MSKRNSTIPAFPRPEAWTLNPEFGTQPAQEGMSLRDYFAGAALKGMAAEIENEARAAKWCYEMADAMLEARDK